MEHTEEEIEGMIGEMKEFVEKLSKEMNGKQVGDILPTDIAMLTSVCLTRLFLHSPSAVMMRDDLMVLASLIANSILKFQEQKREKNSALDKLWKE